MKLAYTVMIPGAKIITQVLFLLEESSQDLVWAVGNGDEELNMIGGSSQGLN